MRQIGQYRHPARRKARRAGRCRFAGYALNGIRQSTLAYDQATGRLATMLAAGSDTPLVIMRMKNKL